MPRPKGSKNKKVVLESKDYTAKIKVLGKVYSSSGSTAKEAIENLSPGTVKGVSILSISKGSNMKDKVLTHQQTFRLFSGSKLMREIAIKNTSILFDGI